MQLQGPPSCPTSQLMYWHPKGLPVPPITPAPRLGRTPTSTTPSQYVLLGDAGAPNPAGVGVEVLEVMYRRGESGALKLPLALSESELFALHLPLDEVELRAEAFGLFIVAAVSFSLCEQPPVWEGCDSIVEGQVGGFWALEEPSEPSGKGLGIIALPGLWSGVQLSDVRVGVLVVVSGEPGDPSL